VPNYPANAYSPAGPPWWELRTWPGKAKQKFGTEPRLAAYLQFNVQVGEILTLRKLREAVGESNRPSDPEHFNRRFRQLRKYGWTVLSNHDIDGLKQGEYRLDRIGNPIWLGKSQFTKKTVSAKVRRQIFEQDGYRCIICGIRDGEPYPDDPTKHARLTLGHFVADSLRGANDPENLRVECSRCNAPAKEELARCESAGEIWPKIRALSSKEKKRLLLWMEQGYRYRDKVDQLFDQYRCLPAAQRDELRGKLTQAVRPPLRS
jgi:5-methylcytosine-specific restriction endonuclease McrA